MHETHLLKNIFNYFQKEEELSFKKIKKVYISLSEFSGIKENHFRQHYKQESLGTRWESLDIEIKKIPCGSELEITRLDFE